MACRWIWLSVLFLLAAGCTRYAIVKYAVGHYSPLDEVPADSSVVLIDAEGWSEEITRSKGASYKTGEALAANLTAALSATYARVRLVHDAAGLGRERCHTLEVELAGIEIEETLSTLDLTLRLHARLRDDEGRERLRKTYTASSGEGGLAGTLDTVIVQVTRSLLADLRAALGRRSATEREDPPAEVARHERLLVLAPACAVADERLSRVLHGILIREAAARASIEVVPEVEVERALRSAEGRALVGCAERGCAVHAAGLVGATSVVFGTLACTPSSSAEPIRLERLDAVAGTVERQHEGTLAPAASATTHEASLLAAVREAAAVLFDDPAGEAPP